MQLNPNAHSISSRIIEPGIENAILRYEIVKRANGVCAVELVKHWVSSHHNAGGTVTTNHRVVMSEIDLCMHQGTIDARRPESIGGIVGRVKELATKTSIPMTVNIPN